MRPFSGQREVLRRLQEQQQATRSRRNEVRQLGGLEPIEGEPIHESNLSIDLGVRMSRGYIGQGGLTIDHHDIMRSMESQIFSSFNSNPSAEIFNSFNQIASNPCSEINFSVYDECNLSNGLTNHMRVSIKEMAGNKKQHNKDYAFLLNKNN